MNFASIISVLAPSLNNPSSLALDIMVLVVIAGLIMSIFNISFGGKVTTKKDDFEVNPTTGRPMMTGGRDMSGTNFCSFDK